MGSSQGRLIAFLQFLMYKMSLEICIIYVRIIFKRTIFWIYGFIILRTIKGDELDFLKQFHYTTI